MNSHAHRIERIEVDSNDPLENMDVLGIDEEESRRRYGVMLVDQLRREYPETAIEVRISWNLGDYLKVLVMCADRECVDTDMIKADVTDTAEYVWQYMEGGWIVMAEAGT